jgi:hypothetical protein
MKLTEPAAGKLPRGSGKLLEQQGEFWGQEPLTCSAANHFKGLPVAANRSSQSTRPVLHELPMQVCFVRGVGSPCSHAKGLAFIAAEFAQE